MIKLRYLCPMSSVEDIVAQLRISRSTLFERLNEARTWLDAWLAAHQEKLGERV